MAEEEQAEESVVTRYEYYLLGRVPVRIAYNQNDDPCMSEVPDTSTGELIIDNSYVLPILAGAPDDLFELSEEDYNAYIKEFEALKAQ